MVGTMTMGVTTGRPQGDHDHRGMVTKGVTTNMERTVDTGRPWGGHVHGGVVTVRVTVGRPWENNDCGSDHGKTTG